MGIKAAWLLFAGLVLVCAWQASAVRTYVATGTPTVSQPGSELLTNSAGRGPIDIPVAGVNTSALRDNFFDARSGHVHHALDIMAALGTPVVAAVDGTIRKLDSSPSGGLTIYEFDAALELSYDYAHLDRYADGLMEGKAVARGQVIGYVGSTGNAHASAPHLHFAIERLTAARQWSRGTPVNPYPILMERGVTTPVSELR